MHFRLIIAFIEDEMTDEVIKVSKEEGAMGATVIGNTHGEGMTLQPTFFGLNLNTPRNMILLLVEKHLSRQVLERIEIVAKLDTEKGMGIAFSLDVDDAVGVSGQIKALLTSDQVEGKLDE